MPRWGTRGRMRALLLCSGLAALAPALLASCKGPRVKLPVRGDDASKDDDDDIVPCDDTRPCMHSILTECGPLGICVECLVNSDCERGVCEPDGECSD